MIQPRRIYDLGLTHKAVAVYCYLCNRADKNGECYPSVRLISKDLSLSKSSVFRAFNELERNGLLQRLPRYHPSGAKVVFANIKRGGILLCQIAVGSLYLFSVPRGMTDGFYSWMKQVIATCLTAFLQTTILYIGLLTYTQHALLAVGICLSANEVPRIAQMFGLDTSVRVHMMSVSSTVSLGTRVAKAFTKK